MSITTSIIIFTFIIALWLLYPLTRGKIEVARLSIIFPFVYFLGYGAGGWAAVIEESPNIFLFNKYYVPQALNFVSLFMGTTLLGFYIGLRSNSNRILKQINIKDNFYNEKLVKWILVCSVIAILLKLYGYGTDILVNTGIHRGVGQWDPWTWKRHGLVLGNICIYILIPIAAICWTRLRNPILFTPVILEMIIRAANFSRAFILPAVFFMLVAILYRGITRKSFLIGISFSIVSLGFMFGIRELAETYGFGVFMQTSLEGGNPTYGLSDRIIRGITVLGKDTTIISVLPTDRDVFNGLISLVNTLLPIPSFFGFDYEQSNLVPLLGFSRNIGIPFSVMGELNYKLGGVGTLFGFPLGIALGILEKQLFNLRQGRNPAHVLIYSSVVYGIVMSLHSPMRASTRVAIYSLGLIILIKLVHHYNNRVFRKIS